MKFTISIIDDEAYLFSIVFVIMSYKTNQKYLGNESSTLYKSLNKLVVYC